MMVWKMIFLFIWVIFRFQGCTTIWFGSISASWPTCRKSLLVVRFMDPMDSHPSPELLKRIVAPKKNAVPSSQCFLLPGHFFRDHPIAIVILLQHHRFMFCRRRRAQPKGSIQRPTLKFSMEENIICIYIYIYLVVSTHLKNISQLESFPQVGVKIKNIWNHHLV